jgi:hypothetical protein
MMLLAALMFAQTPYDPETEAILRHRDKARAEMAQPAAPARTTVARPADADDAGALAAFVPPALAGRYAQCLATAQTDPAAAQAEGRSWLTSGGGAYARECIAFAQGRSGAWADAAASFEGAAGLAGDDLPTTARLLAQAGNAALLAGDSKAALTLFDRALARPLPETLATGEIHLDRARARVAAADLAGGRRDMDVAVDLARSDPLVWLLSATLARRMDDLVLARAHIGEAARRAPDDARVALEEGVIAALAQEDGTARAAFARAQRLAPVGPVATAARDYLAQLDVLTGSAVPLAPPVPAPRPEGR